MGNLTTDLASATKKGEDEAHELGKSAGKHATEKVIQHLKEKHCLTEEQAEAFDKGVQEGKKS